MGDGRWEMTRYCVDGNIVIIRKAQTEDEGDRITHCPRMAHITAVGRYRGGGGGRQDTRGEESN